MNLLSNIIVDEHFDKLKFTLWFIVNIIVLQALAYTLSNMMFVQSTLAEFSGYLYSIFDNNVIIEGNKLIDQASSRFVYVDQKCTAFALIATLLALLLSFPNSIKNKAKSIVWIIILVQIENVIRINHLFYLAITDDRNFDFYHLYLWQGINFIYAIALFILIFSAYYSRALNEVR